VGGVDEGHVQLLDNAANMLVSIPVASFQRSGETRTASVDPAVHRTLCFARLVSGDFSSTIAHVAHRNALRTRRREMPTGAVARALAPFTDGADFDLWMHQAFETLARADLEQTTNLLRLPPRARPRASAMANPTHPSR
jgi:hypothetical protein